MLTAITINKHKAYDRVWSLVQIQVWKQVRWSVYWKTANLVGDQIWDLIWGQVHRGVYTLIGKELNVNTD